MSLILVKKSDTAPASPVDGQLWVDTAGTGTVLKVYNANAAAWQGIDTDTSGMATGTPVDGVQATLTPASAAANSEVTFTAVEYGTSGHTITVAITAGALEAIVVTGRAIAITKSDASTANSIKALVDGHAPAAALVTTAVEGTGAGLIDAAEAAPLASGVNVTAGAIGALMKAADGATLFVKVSAQVWKKASLAAL